MSAAASPVKPSVEELLKQAEPMLWTVAKEVAQYHWEAELKELVQIGLIHALKSIQAWSPATHAPFHCYIRRTARLRMMDAAVKMSAPCSIHPSTQREKRTMKADLREWQDSAVEPESVCRTVDMRGFCRAVIDEVPNLPRWAQEMFRLLYVRNMTLTEISVMLNKKPGGISTKVRRLHDLLRSHPVIAQYAPSAA